MLFVPNPDVNVMPEFLAQTRDQSLVLRVQIAPGGAGGEHDGLHERRMGANPTPAAKRKSRAGENSPALCRQAGHFFRYSASQSKTVRCQSSLFWGLSTQWPSSGK